MARSLESLKTRAVLLTDDDSTVLKMYQHSFGLFSEGRRFSIETETDPRKALEVILQGPRGLQRFDWVVIDRDFGDPEMNGYDIARLIRDSRTNPKVDRLPIVMVSGDADPEIARAAGVNVLLRKPLEDVYTDINVFEAITHRAAHIRDKLSNGGSYFTDISGLRTYWKRRQIGSMAHTGVLSSTSNTSLSRTG